MRALIVTNLYPTPERPRLGRFVFDQVEAIRSQGAEVEVFSFGLGAREYLPAARRLRALLRERSFDVVHAHYGLCGWVASLAGARPLVVTFHGTDVRHRLVGPGSRALLRRIDLIAGASRSTFGSEGGRPGLPLDRGPSAVLPCGVDLGRFRPLPRAEARSELGLDPGGRYLLFPANPERPVKRHDRASEVARLAGAELLVTREVEPERMPLWINAAAAVLVTSDSEGFGLAALEALACGVPLLSTPVGVAPLVAGSVPGCLVTPFEATSWARAAEAHLDSGDPRVDGGPAPELFSAERMGERVLAAYRGLLEAPATA
ncbi:MAG: glycosyltransferase family 4 protein [Actinobacteria bacterium]|nr:glycosyltransferase family 4 protein [Actinomycetota bacterium]